VKTFPTRNDVPQETRAKVVVLLNAALVDLIDLYSQTKVAHWNVKGPQFIAVHELFDSLAEEVEEAIDETAERATALGGIAAGTARQTAAKSRLVEFPTDAFAAPAVLAAVADRFAAVAKTTRAAIDEANKLGDADTADLFTGHSRELDKALWFLEAHLQA
jgi:starvation-inducible DNA-binding protein